MDTFCRLSDVLGASQVMLRDMPPHSVAGVLSLMLQLKAVPVIDGHKVGWRLRHENWEQDLFVGNGYMGTDPFAATLDKANMQRDG